MSEFAVSIHYPIIGDTINISGMIVLVKLANYSPRPLMRVDSVCRRDLFVIYRLTKFRKASGINTGMPVQKRPHITITIK